MARSTARRGTRRLRREVAEQIKTTPLKRSLATEAIGSGELEPSRCSVIWAVKGSAVVHPVHEMQVPPDEGLVPVRRIGTHAEASSRIAMCPVDRGGYRDTLTLESLLEWHHVQQLRINPNVSDIFAQPFAMIWRHKQRHLLHVPDLMARVDGRLRVFNVKPNHRADEAWTRAVMGLVDRTLRTAGVEFELLGDLSRQRTHNLLLISRYRMRNPFLAEHVAAIQTARPTTIGGLFRLLDTVVGGDGTEARDVGVGLSTEAVRVGQEVVKHLLAVGECRTDLDQPLRLASELDWTEAGGGAA